MEIPIQSGDKTHNQLQLITPVSFNTTKTTVNTPDKLIPDELFDELFSVIFQCLSYLILQVI